MNLWDPFDPVTYLLHTILGTAGVVAAVVALSVRKGGRVHVRAGWVFVGTASVAALTAMGFSLVQLSPFAIISSLLVAALLGGALLALRDRTRRVALGETVALGVMALCAVLLVAMTVIPLLFGAPWRVSIQSAAYAVFPIAFVVGDVRFRGLDDRARRRARLNRHLSRMGFAFAIAVHAPIVSFSDELGLHPFVAFFGPFIVWPLIVLKFRRPVSAARRAEKVAG